MAIDVGAFELGGEVAPSEKSRLLVSLRPWVDVGSVGTMAFTFLEEAWGASELGRLKKPGDFYDFTRYRPMIYRHEDRREIVVPNTILSFAHREDGSNWFFLHALEPHAHGDEFVSSLIELISYLGVREYGLIGSMYAPVPHTRPIIASGGAGNPAYQERLQRLGIKSSSYEGPTSIVAMATEEARQRGLETLSLIVQLPSYAQLEQDYRGQHALLQILSDLFDLDLDLESLRREGEQQYAALETMIKGDPRLKRWVQELESAYDAEVAARSSSEEAPRLSPELEQFLKDVEREWDGPSST